MDALPWVVTADYTQDVTQEDMNNVPPFDLNKSIHLALEKNRKTQMYWAEVYLNHCSIIIIIITVTTIMMTFMFTSPLTDMQQKKSPR